MTKVLRRRIVISVIGGVLLAWGSIFIHQTKPMVPQLAAGYPVPYLYDAQGVSVENSLGVEDYFYGWSFLFEVMVWAAMVRAVVEIVENKIRAH